MKLTLIFLLLASFGFAAPKATLDAAEAFSRTVEAELPRPTDEKEDRDRLVAMRVELEKIRRVVGRVEVKWSFSRRASTSKEIVEANRLSTLSDLRTLAENSLLLVARSREVVPESKRAQLETLFISLGRALTEYEGELQGSRYP
jgi:hypothetical protein